MMAWVAKLVVNFSDEMTGAGWPCFCLVFFGSLLVVTKYVAKGRLVFEDVRGR